MTGRDLIVYILENHLENEPVFKNGNFIGFVTVNDVAKKADVGIATIWAWISQGLLSSEYVKEGIYIPADYVQPNENV